LIVCGCGIIEDFMDCVDDAVCFFYFRVGGQDVFEEFFRVFEGFGGAVEAGCVSILSLGDGSG
jgi:hypothetical protein